MKLARLAFIEEGIVSDMRVIYKDACDSKSSLDAVRKLVDDVKVFEEKYVAAYGELPDVLTRNAYDALQFQVRVYVARDGETTCMKERLEETNAYVGVSGEITIDKEDHSVKKKTIFKTVREGVFVEVE